MFIAGLTPGARVDRVFFLREISSRTTKTGEPYLALKLSDRTGVIDARMWNTGQESLSLLAAGAFLHISGAVESYRNRPQIRVESAEPVDAAAVDNKDFIPSSYRDSDEVRGFLEFFLTEVCDTDYSRLLGAFFGDREFLERFLLAPGDTRTHHAYLGGLAEHTVSVATLCQHVSVQHPRLNADLLITSALLHDIGKVEELTFVGSIGLSQEGRLLGHVLLGQRMIEARIRELGGFPREKELILLHALISHHGELEWGAPKRPQSAEALVLHHIDNLDAKVKGFLEVIEGRGQVPWAEMQNFFRRPLDEPMAADRD